MEQFQKRKVGRPANSGKYRAKTQVMRVPADRIHDITRFLEQVPLIVPLYACKVAAGAPVLADDYIEDKVDLSAHLVKKPHTTFLVKVSGESMIKAGIFPGDMLVVDQSIEARHDKIVIAAVDGELTVKRLYQKNGCCRLMPENDAYQPIELSDTSSILGVVKHVIHSFEE